MSKKLLSVTLLGALCAGSAFAAEPAKPEAKTEAKADAKAEQKTDKKDPTQAMMDAMERAGKPGDAHKRLADMAGSFDSVTRMWMMPGAQPVESKGHSENKLLWDGRFLQQDFRGEAMGKPFTGLGMTGYDNTRKRYVATWMDSMDTALAYMEGTMDAAGKVLTMTMNRTDPMTGKPHRMRTVTRVESPDRHVFELYEPGPNGKEFKSMEMVYTRAKGPAAR